MKAMLSMLFAFCALQAAQAQANECTVQITGLRSNSGTCILYLYQDQKGFPTDPRTAIAIATASIQAGRATATFRGVSSGVYAVSVVHDENNNGKLDTNFLGIPREGIGTSNNAKGAMGPPSFDQSRFAIARKTDSIAITIKYL